MPTAPLIPDRSSTSLSTAVQAAQAGDRDAFAQIYAHFVRAVHGIVIGHGIDLDAAEDLTQDVFVTVHQKLGQVRDARALPGWICTIARHTALDANRHAARSPKVTALSDAEPSATDKDLELATTMLNRLRELPEAFRETLAMRLVEGMTGPEIADATGLTQASVRVNLHRGMGKLRVLLEKDGWP